VRVAVIGVGSMGRNHARVYSELEGSTLVSVADVNGDQAADVAGTYGARAYTDYRKMLQQEDLDAVSVVVPTAQHKEVALVAIERGLGLLIEKPISSIVEAGEEIVALARKKNSKLMVGHIERFNPAVIELKKQLDKGRLGAIYRVHANRIGPFAPRIRDVGVAMDLATHDLDIMFYLLGSQVDRAYAQTLSGIRTEYEDLFTATLSFSQGAVGTLDVNWITPIKERWLSIIGEAGMFRLDYQAQSLDFYPDQNSPEAISDPLRYTQGDGVFKESIDIVPGEPLKKELEAFADYVDNGSPPPVNGEDGLRVIKVAQALVEAGRMGEVINFAELEKR
jgi:UDP-N-acetylglucosamine 3-dehydrogenase